VVSDSQAQGETSRGWSAAGRAPHRRPAACPIIGSSSSFATAAGTPGTARRPPCGMGVAAAQFDRDQSLVLAGTGTP